MEWEYSTDPGWIQFVIVEAVPALILDHGPV